MDVGIRSRRLTAWAVVAGVTAAVVVFALPTREGDSGGSDSGWFLGLVLIFGLALLAAGVHTTAATTLLRPVGIPLTVLTALLAIGHAIVAADALGATAVLAAVPAVATPVLLTLAVVAGPVRRPEPAGQKRVLQQPPPPDLAVPGGPPLDVTTPLRQARRDAAASVCAWLVALVVLGLLGAPLLRLFGWPQVTARVQGEVVATTALDDDTAVDFAAPVDGETVTWRHVVDGANWEVGQPVDAYLDEDGGMHFDQQRGLAGTPLLFPTLMLGGVAALAVRRLWGLLIAEQDVRRTDDAPRLGYVALIDDPTPKTIRPLLCVWWADPTGRDRLPKPDAVYRADHQTGTELAGSHLDVQVRVAWVDTGRVPLIAPRWVGTQDGVAVPHRRCMLGRWYVHRTTGKATVRGPAALHHGPPAPRQLPAPRPDDLKRPRFGAMVIWRLIFAAAMLALVPVAEDEAPMARRIALAPPTVLAVEVPGSAR